MRYHPAVVAHAAATLGAMFPGRFWLGLGAGEALNEHILGGEWPEVNVRSEMMFESIEIISKLFEGKVVKHRGKHFKLESAKLYTRPDEPVPIYVATSGPVNAKRTGKFAQGMITVGAADEKIKLLWMECDAGCARGRQAADPEAPADPRQLGADRGGGPRRTPCASGPTAAWPSRSRTSRTPRTSRRWRSSSGRRTSRTAS